MDSLKIPKGKAKPAGTSPNKANAANQQSAAAVPVTVRFNAGDECIEEMFPSTFHNNNNNNGNSASGGDGGTINTNASGMSNSGNSGSGGGGGGGGGGSGGSGGNSLSSSPLQHRQTQTHHGTTAEEEMARHNYFHGNFFGRESIGVDHGVTVTGGGSGGGNSGGGSGGGGSGGGGGGGNVIVLPNNQQLSPNHAALDGTDATFNTTTPIAICGGGGGGGGGVGGGGGGSSNNQSGHVTPNANSGISPHKYQRSGGYSHDTTSVQAGVSTMTIGNGSNTAGATGGGDAPFLGPNFCNGLNMRPIDNCFKNIVRSPAGTVGPGGGVGVGVGGGGGGGASSSNSNNTGGENSMAAAAAAVIAERMRQQNLNEHHPVHPDGTVGMVMTGHSYLDSNMKLTSPVHLPVGNGEHAPRYSRKVFVGGLPPDIDEDEITVSFRRFGALVVDWPHKAESKSYFPPKGYAFLLFQDESSVQQLIDACITDDEKLYLCVSSPTIKDKPVQIRPWRLGDADYVLDASMPLDPRKTVFVGGVPRPLKAFELAMIMDRLYGGVCYAGIDTDPELKYPKGAGRVAFSNQQSYIAAISARFVQLLHGDIDKRVEVKPYVLDDQMCDECEGQRCHGKFAPFFCANITCLQYYCEHCWTVIHSRPGREYHKPLVKEGADRPRAVPFRW